jgi:hypothetical protein
MNWFKKKHREVITPEVFGFFLLKITHDNVNSTSRVLKRHLDASEHSKLPKVEEELVYFFVFALEYWWATDSNRTQEERRIVRQAFEAHLSNLVNMDVLQERLITYTQIANEEKGDDAKFLGFGRKLSEYCVMPLDPRLLALAPALFADALRYLGTLQPVRLKLR